VSYQQWQPAQPAQHGMLASDAAREGAVEILKGAYAEGRLVMEEYDDRVGRAYQARTYGELDAVIGDIPQPLPPAFRPAPLPRTNGKAVAALICGVGGIFVGLSAIPAIVLGHMARREIRRTGEQGDGMAVGGMVLGYVVTVLMAGMVVLAVVALVAFQDVSSTTSP
jgi:predicted RNA-binding protein with TRAM domain